MEGCDNKYRLHVDVMTFLELRRRSMATWQVSPFSSSPHRKCNGNELIKSIKQDIKRNTLKRGGKERGDIQIRFLGQCIPVMNISLQPISVILNKPS